MNKTELVNAMAAQSGMSKIDSAKAVEAFIKAVTQALRQEDKVIMAGFGTFSVITRHARQGVNPATLQKIDIDARRVVKFKAGAILADKVKA